MELLNGTSFWDKILAIFDIIPKVIYYLYAALASGVDALQLLVRKLAGLDTYWASTGGGNSNAVTGQDPLTEFINGIFGVGESASVYKALNTVFWSLAIFGLIMLVISTMVAIIKSHYNEDTAGTSPWKYIYTAIKAILTFVIVPVIVVIGMQICTFALSTLDKITAGTTDSSAIEGVYGGSALSQLDDGGSGNYGHYDFFGARQSTSTTPFSGMLFKSAGYNANRARNSSAVANAYKSLPGGIFGEGTSSSEDIAYQIDYAFANCLMYKSGSEQSYNSWKEYVNKENICVIGLADIFKPDKVKGFSKWDVSVVWMFYDLWKFNFIIGFVAVTVSFSVLVSIIFGLITRLIKSAALFLIFPALLGIAPMDNFKAFKSWGTQFMQQVLMVFGAILGMNLLLLILPYMQNIKFFDPNVTGFGVLNALMDTLILVVGLGMAKDFIGIVNGFVGGADVIAAGDSAKESAKRNLTSAAKMTIGAGKVAAGGMALVGKAAVTGGMMVGKNIWGEEGKTNRAVRRANRRDKSAEKNLIRKQNNFETAEFNVSEAQTEFDEAKHEWNSVSHLKAKGKQQRAKEYKMINGIDDSEMSDEEAFNIVKQQAKENRDKAGQKLDTAKAKRDKAGEKLESAAKNKTATFDAKNTMNARAESEGFELKTNKKGEVKGIVKSENPFVGKSATYKVEKNEDGTDKVDKKGKPVYARDEKGSKIIETEGSGIKGLGSAIGKNLGGFGKNFADEFQKSISWSGIGKNIADGLAKSLEGGMKMTGIDKLTKDLQDVAKTFKQTTIKAPNALDGKEGDKLTKEVANEQKKRDEEMQKLLEKIAKNTEKTPS